MEIGGFGGALTGLGKVKMTAMGIIFVFSIRLIKRITEIGEDEEGSSRKILKVKTLNKRKIDGESNIYILIEMLNKMKELKC